jgi:hypothetical protein
MVVVVAQAMAKAKEVVVVKEGAVKRAPVNKHLKAVAIQV